MFSHADVPIFPAVIPSPLSTHIINSPTLVKFMLPTANQTGLSGHLLLPQRTASVNYQTHPIQMPDYPQTIFSKIHPLSKSQKTTLIKMFKLQSCCFSNLSSQLFKSRCNLQAFVSCPVAYLCSSKCLLVQVLQKRRLQCIQ